MAASIQIYGGCIRDHGPKGEYGDHYEWTCGFMTDPDDHTLAIILGAMISPTMQTIGRIKDALRPMGFKWVGWWNEDGQWHQYPIT